MSEIGAGRRPKAKPQRSGRRKNPTTTITWAAHTEELQRIYLTGLENGRQALATELRELLQVPKIELRE